MSRKPNVPAKKTYDIAGSSFFASSISVATIIFTSSEKHAVRAMTADNDVGST